jgi:hypothetical protein
MVRGGESGCDRFRASVSSRSGGPIEFNDMTIHVRVDHMLAAVADWRTLPTRRHELTRAWPRREPPTQTACFENQSLQVHFSSAFHYFLAQ